MIISSLPSLLKKFSVHTRNELFSGDIRPNQILLIGILHASWDMNGLCFNRKAISRQERLRQRGRFLVRSRSVSSGLLSKNSWSTSHDSLMNSLYVDRTYRWSVHFCYDRDGFGKYEFGLAISTKLWMSKFYCFLDTFFCVDLYFMISWYSRVKSRVLNKLIDIIVYSFL